MPKLENAGEYLVQIREPRWEEAKQGMALVLPGWMQIAGEEKHINAYLYFTPTLISGGRNQGRPMYEVNAELCHQIGMSEPFSPEKLDELDGLEAFFVVQEEEYEGKTRLKVAFVNPARKPAMSVDEAKEVWERLVGGKVKPTPKAAEPKQTANEIDPADDLPF